MYKGIKGARTSTPSLTPIAGIPEVYHFGVEGDFNVMIMELLGPSMDSLFTMCDHKFSLRTVLMFADQAVTAYL